MFGICDKNFSKFWIVNFVQDVFGFAAKPVHHVSKRLIHHLRKHKHFALSYIHILLLLLCLYALHITTFNNAEDLLPEQQPAIVIENEPQIIPEQQQPETIMTGEQPSVSSEVSS